MSDLQPRTRLRWPSFFYEVIQDISLVPLQSYSSNSCKNHEMQLLQGKQNIPRMSEIRNRSNFKCLMLAECGPSSALPPVPFWQSRLWVVLWSSHVSHFLLYPPFFVDITTFNSETCSIVNYSFVTLPPKPSICWLEEPCSRHVTFSTQLRCHPVW